MSEESAENHLAIAKQRLAQAQEEMGRHVDSRTERTIALDFDGVIHGYSKGYHDGTIYDEALPGAFDGIKRLMRFACVYILSTRDANSIVEWMGKRTEIPCIALPKGAVRWKRPGTIGVTNEKLLATHFVDDRAVRFTNWTDIANLLG